MAESYVSTDIFMWIIGGLASIYGIVLWYVLRVLFSYIPREEVDRKFKDIVDSQTQQHDQLVRVIELNVEARHIETQRQLVDIKSSIARLEGIYFRPKGGTE